MENVKYKKIMSCFVVLVVLVLTSNIGAADAGISPSGDSKEQASVPFEPSFTSQTSDIPPAFGLAFQLTNPDLPDVEFTINMDMASNRIVGGNISGNICDSPNWLLTDGIITKSKLVFTAIHTGSASCAHNVLVNTVRSGKTTFSGTYTWNYDTDPTVYNAVLTFIDYIPYASKSDVPVYLEELVAGR